jgi:hypothetical protein
LPAARSFAASLALRGAVLVDRGVLVGVAPPAPVAVGGSAASRGRPAATHRARLDARAVVEAYCLRCHDDARRRGNLSLEGFDPAMPERNPVIAEKVIVKLRAGMMPPPGVGRPAGDTLAALVRAIEQRVDAAAAAAPNPGARTFQRLNRAEYERSVEALLGLRIDAADYLPPDTKSENFDNIADAQLMSPMLLDAYLNAAAEIARLAVGDPAAEPARVTYAVSGYRSQTERVPGAPFGTRGGVVVEHVFPADGEYGFSLDLEHTTTGEGFGGLLARGELVEVSVEGEGVALLDVDAWLW